MSKEIAIKGKYVGSFIHRVDQGRTLTIGSNVYTALGLGKWKGADGKKLTWIEVSALASALGDKEVIYKGLNKEL